ncbi:sodium:solute symporter family transporter [Calderihabitans maritimus]|uniref:Na+/panthothenate symporter n=1 Tax=Calderihabitans maritimus TaxID=1246530 RepID=A0A1Z5HMT3_9FIRM|nr:sodium/solute symporter [Calderihabitans maritimus]GAW90846.1 Na+/panthothenate symporter [Calderihabitans maritimus]
MKWLVILMYVGMLLVVGYLGMKKTRTVDDFFLGNRSIGPWVSAFAYGTTYFSAVLFIGYAGKVGWGFGLSSLWIVLGNALIGSYLAWKVLAGRTRAMTSRLGTLTLPEFLAARYDSKALKIVAALIIFIFLVPYSASVYMGLSYLFEEIFGIPFIQALLFMALLTALYLVMGGYFALTLTDFIQGLVMIGGVILLLVYVVGSPQVGGIGAAIEKLARVNPQLVKPVGPPGVIPLVSLVILTSLGTWGLPQMVQKFYSIKDEKSIPQAIFVSTGFAFLMTFGAYFTGALSRLFFEQVPQGNPDVIMPQIISQALPEAVAVVILLLVLAASMSTLASLVLVSSSAIAIDLVQEIIPNLKKDRVVLLMRVLCVVFIGLSLYIALKPTIILNLMSISWGTVAGAFLAPYLYGLYWKGVTRAGAWSGVISGLGISLGLSLLNWLQVKLPFTGGLSIPVIGSLAIVIPLLVVPAVSWITEGYPEEHLKRVFGYEKSQLECGKEGLVTHDLG